MDAPSATLSLTARVEKLERQLELTQGLLEMLLWAVAALPLAVLLLTVRRAGGPVWPLVFDALHFLVSAAVALVALRLSRRTAGLWWTQRWPHYLAAMAVVFALGAALEVAQRFVPGTPSLRDLWVDVAGGATALLLRATLDKSFIRSIGARLGCVGAALLLLVAGTAPTGRGLLGVIQRARAFPVLLNFAEPGFRQHLELNAGATLNVVNAPPGHTLGAARVAELILPAAETYPGVEFAPPLGDWGDYRALAVDVHSPMSASVQLHVRVDDRRHNGHLTDRFNHALQIAPGDNHIRIALRDIQQAPKGRQMDLGAIGHVVLFMVAPKAEHRLLLGPIRLEHADGG